MIILCKSYDDYVEPSLKLGKTDSPTASSHPLYLSRLFPLLIYSSPRTHTWLKGTVLQVSQCTSWLLMGKMTPWESGPFLNMKWCQNFLASSRRGDFSTFFPSVGWGRPWAPGGELSLFMSPGGYSSLSGFFQNLPNLDSIFSLCLWSSPARLVPIRCGTATNRSGLSSASSWVPVGSSWWLLSRSTRERELWLSWSSRCQPAFPRGRSTSSWSKSRCMLSEPKIPFGSQMVRPKKAHSTGLWTGQPI